LVKSTPQIEFGASTPNYKTKPNLGGRRQAWVELGSRGCAFNRLNGLGKSLLQAEDTPATTAEQLGQFELRGPAGEFEKGRLLGSQALSIRLGRDAPAAVIQVRRQPPNFVDNLFQRRCRDLIGERWSPRAPVEQFSSRSQRSEFDCVSSLKIDTIT
jgi:hypothetical protein